MIGEWAAGVIGDLIVGGLKRGVSVAFQKVARLQNVDAASRGVLKNNSNVKLALSDFETVLGGYQGNFTTTHDAFFKQLAQTGILDAMVENALISRPSEATEKLFAELHGDYFPRIDATPLYKSMMAAFSVTLREMSKDTLLFDLIHASQRDLATRLERVDQAISSLHVLFPTNSEDFTSSTLRIAKALAQSYKSVRVETNRGPRDIEINKIYVPPKLTFRDGNSSKRMDAFYKVIRSRRSRIENERPYLSIAEREKISAISYGDLTESFRRVVILGDPGGGKSTLCQKFCYDMAKNCALKLQFENKTSHAERLSFRLPIRIILRKFEQARSVDPQLDILQYMTRDIINISGGEIDEVKGTIKRLLSCGSVALCFDGLDEILDTSMRQDYVDLVSAFCGQYPLCPVLITSRFVGYDDARLPDEFEEILLRKFDDSEVEAYLIKFMKVVGSKKPVEAQKDATKFLSQTEDTAFDLRRNPLMLGLMSWLFLNSGDVPSNRPEIYRECAILMFERWDQRRGIVADSVSDFDRSELFIQLASKIYGEPQYAAGVSRSWMEEALLGYFSDLYENKAKAQRAAREFVKFITGRAWVMTEVGDSVFSFTHQTFLEYFFARYLDDKYDSVADLLRFLRPRIAKSEWNEVAHLALQLKTHRSLRKQEEAISVLRRFINEARSLKSQHAITRFSIRSFEYISPTEKTLADFLDYLFEISAAKIHSDGLVFLESLVDASERSADRKEFVQGKVELLLSAALTAGAPLFRSAVFKLVSNNSTLLAERDARPLCPEALAKAVRERIAETVKLRAKSDAFFAGLSWSWYGQFDIEVIKKFGISVIFNFPHMGSILDLDGLTSLAIAAGGQYGDPRKRPIINAADAKTALHYLVENLDDFLPLDRKMLDAKTRFGGPPDHIWKEIYKQMNGDKLAAAGAIVARHVALQLRSARRRPVTAHAPRNGGIRTAERELLKGDLGLNEKSFEMLRRIVDGNFSVFSDLPS